MVRYPMSMNRDNSVTEGNTDTRCQHATAESLGFNNGMEFLRCLTCRSIIVTQGALRFAIPPVRAAG